MASEEDQDLILQRASNTLLQKLLIRLPNLLRKKNGHHANPFHRFARQKDVDYILTLVGQVASNSRRSINLTFVQLNPFKESPQLLDNHLVTFLPSLFTAYLHRLNPLPQTLIKSDLLPLTTAISKIACAFCDIRGYKIITRFLNNEPHLIKRLSERLCHISNHQAESNWEERYLLILWISHLLLTPFDLAVVVDSSKSLSAFQPCSLLSKLPDGLPKVAGQLVEICLRLIQSPAKEREVAALALSRLCSRPDMRKLHLTETVVASLTTQLKADSPSTKDIHINLGIMLFLERFAATADNNSWHLLRKSVCPVLLEEFEEQHPTPLTSSAAAKRLYIKFIRHWAIHHLIISKGTGIYDETNLVEQTINYLFVSVSDKDHPVRFAAGKALSTLVRYLEPLLSGDVVDSLLLPLGKEQSEPTTLEDYSSSNHLECHGLTMALSFMLYQESIPFSQIGRIMDHLRLAFNFHQLSSAGVSIGSNVRDAACFGLWSLSRRYSNRKWDLPSEVFFSEVTRTSYSVSAVQNVALELLAASCLDPVGNIRRGASAALQELVGRNHDEVEQGISLIQITDYQAVGLTERAVCKVAVQAAGLHELYWNKLLLALLGWRGIASVNITSRINAATALGQMCMNISQGSVIQIIDYLFRNFFTFSAKDFEKLHGTVLAISSIVKHRIYMNSVKDFTKHQNDATGTSADISSFYNLFSKSQSNMYTALKKLRPAEVSVDIQGVIICSLLCCMADIQIKASEMQLKCSTKPLIDKADVFYLIELYLHCSETYFLKALADLFRKLYDALDPDELVEFAERCVEKIQQGVYRYGKRSSGRLIAIGNAIATPKLNLNIQGRLLDELCARCTSDFSIQNRVIAFRSIKQIFEQISVSYHFETMRDRLGAAILVGLNDYTIDERGDVGSLVRSEALIAVQEGLKNDVTSKSILNDSLRAATERLALEKMDKIRMEAALCLELSGRVSFSQ